jgi:hypothetical protein
MWDLQPVTMKYLHYFVYSECDAIFTSQVEQWGREKAILIGCVAGKIDFF